MKNASPLKCVAFLLLISFNFQTSFSQDLALSNFLKPLSKSYAISNNIVVKNAVLEDGNYTYIFKEKNISVEIKDGYYYEYHPNKEYIKAKIDWVTEYKYNLVIVDIEKRASPLKIGSKLTAEITKIEGDEYFYTSVLNNKKGSGSFKKVK
ncbi:hypothetical protein [Polaribacter sp. SA4-12]|uniref:hypothetical protein n=1 Tax=Polaribacter sp. SA4-12 TaxID=1312072 RepID=UPI000B3C0F86|nr:hypothetical protein [Polaribacter sp. SA4-12]ARV15641.1 hypothetical protein BTO07_11050 [Polaribacter sp. SA4-12]